MTEIAIRLIRLGVALFLFWLLKPTAKAFMELHDEKENGPAGLALLIMALEFFSMVSLTIRAVE